MSGAPFDVGDEVTLKLVVVAIDRPSGLVLVRPAAHPSGERRWVEPGDLFPDHLTPPPPPQTDPASD